MFAENTGKIEKKTIVNSRDIAKKKEHENRFYIELTFIPRFTNNFKLPNNQVQ